MTESVNLLLKIQIDDKKILPFLFLVFYSAVGFSQEKALVPGMKISRSVRIKKALYKLDAPADTSRHIIIIEGNNITIDFNNAELKGSNTKKGRMNLLVLQF